MNVYPIYIYIISIPFTYLHPQHAFFKLNLTPNKKTTHFLRRDPHNFIFQGGVPTPQGSVPEKMTFP